MPYDKVNNGYAALLLLLLFVVETPVAVDSSINPFGIRVFGDFLRSQQLTNGIVIVDGRDVTLSLEIRAVLSENAVSFYSTQNANFRAYFQEPFPRVGVAMLEFNKDVLQSFASNDLLSNDRAWLILMEKREGLTESQSISEAFAAVNMNIDADITVAIKQNSNNTVRLYDVYKVCHICGSPLQVQYKGIWSPAEGYKLEAIFQGPPIRRRRNFGNITINGGYSIIKKPPQVSDAEFMENSHIYQEYDDIQRKGYHLLLLMKPHWNVSFNVTIRNSWGAQLSNGSWDGIVGDILNGQVDVSLCPLRMTTDRLKVVDFSSVIHTESVVFLFRHPRHSAIRNIFLSPLSPTVWWTLLALVMLTILLLAILLALERRRIPLIANIAAATTPTTTRTRNELPPAPPIEMRPDFIMLTVWEALVIQGPDPVIFRTPSTRLLIFSICLFSVLLQQFYSAFIVGSLLTPEPRTITTPTALYNSSLDIGMEDYAFQHELFKQSSAIGRAIYTNRICSASANNILQLREGIQRIARGGFAFHASSHHAYLMLKSILEDSAFCELQAILMFPPVTAPIGWRKRWPFREYFANSILHYRSTGLMQYNDKQWEVPYPDCALSAPDEVQVDMEHFLPAIMVLATAIVISVLVLLIEVVIKKYWRWIGEPPKRNHQPT